jgi:Ca2+-binding RTX toxin-like protein
MTVLVGDGNENTLIGGNNIDTLFGMGGDDVLKGAGGNDALIGGTGDDIMLGGTGHDVYVVDSANDDVVEFANQGIDWIEAYVDYTLAEHVDNMRLMGTGDLNATGNSTSNYLDGNNGDNVLDGKGGSDFLEGGGGNDTYYVDNVDDICSEVEDQGIDTVYATVDYDVLGAVENLILLGSADIDGTGSDDDNQITGNSGANRLTGELGADVLTGGGGADTFVWLSLAESGLDAASVDVITDFNAAAGDEIDVSAIDANGEVGGNQTFTFIGTAAYSGAGQIRVVSDGIDTYLAFSTDSDPDNDGAVKLLGLVTPDASWFVL